MPFLYFETYAVALYFFLIYRVFDWYNDVWLITDLGVVDVDWDIFARNIIYIDYHDIKGSEIQNHSFWDSVFHMGDIILYTAGDRDDFILEGAEYPDDIADHIEEVVHELEKNKKQKEKEPMELLLHTLTEVVRDHLEGNTHRGTNEEDEDEEALERALAKKGTIDLR